MGVQREEKGEDGGGGGEGFREVERVVVVRKVEKKGGDRKT